MENGQQQDTDALTGSAPPHVIAILPEPRQARACLDLAAAASTAVGATMTVSCVAADPAHMIASVEEIDLQFLREPREGSSEARAAAVKTAFEEWKRAEPGRGNVSFRDHRGSIDECVRNECVGADLVVAPRSGNLDARDVLHELIFTGRNLVLVPPERGGSAPLTRHVVVGWKPDEQVYAAVRAARRWLAAADKLTVVCVDDSEDGRSRRTAQECFADLNIACDVVQIDSGSRSVGAALVDFCGTARASCLVTGAFRHGYLVELILGRVTYHLLSHADIPLILKH